LTARELQRLGRVELDGAPAPASAAGKPRVWIGVPDRRAEGAVTAAVIGAAAGAVIGAVAASGGTGMFAALGIYEGILIGAPAGALVGAPIGALLGAPGEGDRRAAAKLREVARAIDVTDLAHQGARASAALTPPAAVGATRFTGAGARLSIDVIAYGTRPSGGGRTRPFVAARTRLTEGGTGKVLYDTTSDWRGPEKTFYRWAKDGGEEFRGQLQAGAAALGRRCARRALTPRKGAG
jgi:hypothetical protein